MTRYSLVRSTAQTSPLTCPTCGKPATVQVGGRGYSDDCARAMRLYLSSISVRTDVETVRAARIP